MHFYQRRSHSRHSCAVCCHHLRLQPCTLLPWRPVVHLYQRRSHSCDPCTFGRHHLRLQPCTLLPERCLHLYQRCPHSCSLCFCLQGCFQRCLRRSHRCRDQRRDRCRRPDLDRRELEPLLCRGQVWLRLQLQPHCERQPPCSVLHCGQT